MEIFHTIIVSVGSIIALFILTKLMGYRQMSQLSMFDYINGITIGSIAAEMATSLENDFMPPLLAMIIYAGTAILLSRLSEASVFLRRIIVGKPVLLMNKGKLYEKNMKKNRLDLGEFLTQCRIAGYFDLSELQSVIMEPNGHISFLPKADHRPMQPSDLSIRPAKDTIFATVIMDGEIMYENLRHTGNNEKWLTNQLKGQGITNVRNVFLATCDENNTLNIYVKIQDKPKDMLL
ncbi:MAG: DUF421 domain-containing protein [Catenibacillus sp.]